MSLYMIALMLAVELLPKKKALQANTNDKECHFNPTHIAKYYCVESQTDLKVGRLV